MSAATPGPVDWEEAILQRSIKLDEVDTDVFCASKDDLWRPPGARGVFGGQTICQTLHAAILSAPSNLAVHSFHGYFLLAGDPDRNIVFHVERVRDGGSFVTRAVEARQRGKAIFVATVQFHRPEPSRGLEVSEAMPPVPDPEGLKSDREILAEMAEDPGLSARMREFYRTSLSRPARAERRQVPRPRSLADNEPVEWFWTRVAGKLSDDVEIHLICMAYMSDMGMLSPAYVPFGGIRRNQPSMMVSLDHSMWFHSRNFRADDWLLVEIRCIKAGNARILSLSKVWTRAGELVFSCAQEGLARHSEQLQPLPVGNAAPSAKL
uniref:Acyl-CoA thioesterase II n=1 Tax=Alexandrium monilatum TaxID=311494 RepID=A0A7S4Q790_9DINO